MPKPSIKLRAYPRKQIDKEKIKLGAAMQREQQKQRAEELLQQDINVDLMQGRNGGIGTQRGRKTAEHNGTRKEQRRKRKKPVNLRTY